MEARMNKKNDTDIRFEAFLSKLNAKGKFGIDYGAK